VVTAQEIRTTCGNETDGIAVHLPSVGTLDAGRGDRLIVRDGRMAVASAGGIVLVDMRGKTVPAVASGARGNVRHGVYIAVTGDGSMRKQEKLLLCR